MPTQPPLPLRHCGAPYELLPLPWQHFLQSIGSSITPCVMHQPCCLSHSATPFMELVYELVPTVAPSALVGWWQAASAHA
jgi:hypothetical protein